MLELVKKVIRSMEDADGELDSIGVPTNHHVRQSLDSSIRDMKNLLKELKERVK